METQTIYRRAHTYTRRKPDPSLLTGRKAAPLSDEFCKQCKTYYDIIKNLNKTADLMNNLHQDLLPDGKPISAHHVKRAVNN